MGWERDSVRQCEVADGVGAGESDPVNQKGEEQLCRHRDERVMGERYLLQGGGTASHAG